jgi:hypothetical protein
MGTRNSLKNSAETIRVLADQPGDFKNCCLRDGTFDGSRRHYYFWIISKTKHARGSGVFFVEDEIQKLIQSVGSLQSESVIFVSVRKSGGRI